MPFGTGIWEVFFLALFLLAYSIPAYVIGRRRRIPNSGVAFDLLIFFLLFAILLGPFFGCFGL